MKKLSFTEKKQALTNALRSFGIPEKYFIADGGARLNRTFVLASNSSVGGRNLHTDLMTYEEFNCFLMGYNKAITKPLN